VVVKRRSSCYLSGERGWVKVKNREYWRYEFEREAAFRRRSTPAAHSNGGFG
jgi:hypothetical protein